MNIKEFIYENYNVNSTESFFKIKKQPKNLCPVCDNFLKNINDLEIEYNSLMNYLNDIDLSKLFQKDNNEYNFYVKQLDDARSIILNNKIKLEEMAETIENYRLMSERIRSQINDQKNAFWTLENISFGINKKYNHHYNLNYFLEGFEFSDLKESDFFDNNLRFKDLKERSFNLEILEEMRSNIYEWGYQVCFKMNDFFPNLIILSKSPLLFKLNKKEKINWKEESQNEIPEEIIDILIKQENIEALMLIISCKKNDFSYSQIRDLIHIGNEDILMNLENHFSFESYKKQMFCKTEEDFKNHTIHHIENVKDITLDIIDLIYENTKYLNYFKINNYSKNEFRKFMYQGINLHDKAKINEDSGFLSDNNLEEPLFKTLYKYYGRGINEELKTVIQKLNKIDNSIIDSYLKNKEENLVFAFKKLERLADCIERGSNEVTSEEMGTEPISASDFLKGSIPDIELEIVKIMEKKYKQTYYSG